ncbi:MAG: HDOD domain-containing protein [Candidatus Hydrogenedentota bacterium]|nr:MAG: HDOD domain-containing protein [Candidatus Hydrogenedentota bacterium]
MANPGLKRIVERIQDLPTLPTVVTRILKLVHDPESNAADVQMILGRDQSLSTKVMKLVNSAFYGYAGKIKTLHQAVVILGFDTIKSVALSATVFTAFAGGRKNFDRDAFWRHSIATGVAARLLARECRMKEIEESFMCGVIHDIGKVVLDQYAPGDFDRVLAYVQEKNCLIYEAERAVLGSSHAQVGRWLGMKWGLPAEIVDVIFYHHQPANAQRAPKQTAVVHVADILARTRKLGSGGDAKVPPLDPAAWEKLGLDEGRLKGILAVLPDEFAKADLFVQMARG